MRRSLPTLLALVVICAAAGVAIAGLPEEGDTFVITRTQAIDTTTSDVATSEAATVPTTSTTADTALAPAEATTTIGTVEQSAPGEAVEQTSTTQNSVASSSEGSTTTVSARETTVQRSAVRLVIANGDGRFNLAGSNGNRLRAAGYETIDLTDIGSRVDATILYFRPGYEDEAAIVAADLLVPNAVLEPLPSQPVTINDQLGDVIVVLGPDSAR